VSEYKLWGRSASDQRVASVTGITPIQPKSSGKTAASYAGRKIIGFDIRVALNAIVHLHGRGIPGLSPGHPLNGAGKLAEPTMR
jgi:hypothetical protein